jgi:hypothetical protein|tara:strand:- start:377 stop:481 length:105 start_codon:yes stop_codon:yes gene_type:complete
MASNVDELQDVLGRCHIPDIQKKSMLELLETTYQ